eukprot:Opistho-2@38766
MSFGDQLERGNAQRTFGAAPPAPRTTNTAPASRNAYTPASTLTSSSTSNQYRDGQYGQSAQYGAPRQPTQSYGGGGASTNSSYGGTYQSTALALNPVSSSDSDYNRAFDRITKTIFEVSNNVASIQRLVGALGTPKDTEENRRKLNETRDATRRQIRGVTGDMKQLALMASDGRDMQQRSVRQQKLSRDFQDILKQFEAVEKNAAVKEKATIARAKEQRSFGRPTRNYDDEEGEGEDASFVVSNKRAQQQQQLDHEIEYNESLIIEREREIREIEHAIIEVNEIFRDLASIIADQGQLIDNIEANIESSSVNVEKGTEELVSASDYQKSARKKMCCLLIILAIVAGVIVAIVMIELKK